MDRPSHQRGPPDDEADVAAHLSPALRALGSVGPRPLPHRLPARMSVNSFTSASKAKGLRRALVAATTGWLTAPEDAKEKESSTCAPTSPSSLTLSSNNQHHTQPGIGRLLDPSTRDRFRGKNTTDESSHVAAGALSFLTNPRASLAGDGLSRPSPAIYHRSRTPSRVNGHSQWAGSLLKRAYNCEFQELNKLGSGAYGSVFRSQHRLDGNIYAVKKVVLPVTVPKNAFELDYQAFILGDFRTWIREAQTMAAVCKHPNLVRYHQSWLELLPRTAASHCITSGSATASSFGETFSSPSVLATPGSLVFGDSPSTMPISELSDDWNDDYTDGEAAEVVETKSLGLVENDLVLFIQMELCSGASLHEWLRVPGRSVDPKESMRLFKQLMYGLEHLHSKGYVHRDVKPANLLIVPKVGRNALKIGDFGCCKKLTDMQNCTIADSALEGASPEVQHTQGCGTFFYMPPELHTTNYDEKVDIFSAGIVLFELFNVFSTECERRLVLTQLHEKRLVPTEFMKNYPREANLVLKMTHRDPMQRPSAVEILNNSQYGLCPVEVLDLAFDPISANDASTEPGVDLVIATSPTTAPYESSQSESVVGAL